MSYLSSIALPTEGQVHRPIGELEKTHGINRRAAVMYDRFYGLKEVTQHSQSLERMLGSALEAALDQLSVTARAVGQLVYCKTQTHNTFASDNWLRGFADRHGLHDWEVSSLSMTSCASALVQMHMTQLTCDADTPLIVLTGEKTFHPWVSRLPVGLLAEIPVAAVFNTGPGGWWIAGSTVRHLPRFHENPDVMSTEDRRALQAAYAPELIAFVETSLQEYGPRLASDVVFLPHNLNLPMTQLVLDHFGCALRCFQGDVARTGHGFCSDIFLNLDAFTADGGDASQVLVLAAGTGVTFATCLLDRMSQS